MNEAEHRLHVKITMQDDERKEAERSIADRTANSRRPSYGSFWDKELYDAMLELEYDPDLVRGAEQLLAGKKVLVLGAGRGEVSLVQASTDDITALNIAEKPLLDVRKHFPHVRTIVADAEKLDSLEERFDVVYCQSVLHHLHPIEDVLASIARKLRSGGILFVAMEPGRRNPFAVAGRKFTPSRSHTPGERPFVFSEFRVLVEKHFDVLYENQYFVWSMLFPIAAKRAPRLRPLLRLGLQTSIAVERRMRAVTALRDLYWVMMGAYRVREGALSDSRS